MRFELKGAYRLILDLIYMQSGKLPDDSRYISGLLGCSVKKWNSLRLELLSLGKIVCEGGVLTNLRAITELETLGRFQDKQSVNASRPRKINDLPEPRPSHTEPDTDIVKRDTNVSPKKSNGTRIPDGFEPDLRWAEENGLNPSQAIFESSQFKDYWTAKAGAAATKKDWPATWRTWVRNSVHRQAAKQSYPKPKSQTPGDVMREMMNGSERQNPNGYLENNERPATFNDIRLIPGTGWGG